MWLAAFVAGAAQGAAAPEVPGAGTLLQQAQPPAPSSPLPNDTGLKVQPLENGKLPPSAPFLVQTLTITGNALFDTPTLHALVADAEGRMLTLPELGALAARITDYYQHHGYPLSRAIIPVQVIEAGAVKIQVIEARLGAVKLDNHSRVSDRLLEATLSPLQPGRDIAQQNLDHRLLLLGDIPGVIVDATLKPGEVMGTSDLVVQAHAGPVLTGSLAIDDFGNRYTGRERVGGTLNAIEPLHDGDVLSANVLSAGHEMDYGRVSYELALTGNGARVGGSYSTLHYILGDTLASLEGHGSAEVDSLWAKQPLVRTRDLDLYGQLQFDRKQLSDDIDVSSIHTDRHLDNWTASLSGDQRDAFLSGGVNTWSLGLTSGQVGFDDATAQRADAATAKTQGRFLQWNATLARLQSLTPKDALYVAVSGQWANANLDPSQKMVAGGPYTVRAYDMSAVSGDIGVQASAELRHDLARARHGQWQAVAFLDSERVRVNKNVWTTGINEATLSGAGLGLEWTGPAQWSAKTYIAVRLGAAPALVGSAASARAWLEVGKGF